MADLPSPRRAPAECCGSVPGSMLGQPRPFTVRATVDGLTGLIWVEGDLDLSSAALLDRSVTSVVDAGAPFLVVDLGGVSFLDCTGLRVLINARQLAGSRGGLLHLTSVPPRVRRVLLLTGACSLLEPVQRMGVGLGSMTGSTGSAAGPGLNVRTGPVGWPGGQPVR